MKKKKLKVYKIASYLIGMPLLLLAVVISILPILGEDIFGKAAMNCVLITIGIWAIIELTKFLVKPLKKKGLAQRDIANIIVAAIAVVVLVLPISIYNITAEKDYKETQEEAATYGITLDNYDYLMGKFKGFTNSDKSTITDLINASDAFIEANGLLGFDTTTMGTLTKDKDGNYISGDPEDENSIPYGKYLGVKETLERELKLIAIAKADAKVYLEANYSEYKVMKDNLAKLQLDPVTNTIAIEAQLKALSKYEITIAITGDALVGLIQGVLGNLGLYVAEANVLEILEDGIITGEEITVLLSLISPDLAETLGPIIVTIFSFFDGSINISELLGGMDSMYISVGGDMSTALANATAEDKAELGIEVADAGLMGTITGLLGGLLGGDMAEIDYRTFGYQIDSLVPVVTYARLYYYYYMLAGLIVLSIFLTDYFSRRERANLDKEEEEFMLNLEEKLRNKKGGTVL